MKMYQCDPTVIQPHRITLNSTEVFEQKGWIIGSLTTSTSGKRVIQPVIQRDPIGWITLKVFAGICEKTA